MRFLVDTTLDRIYSLRMSTPLDLAALTPGNLSLYRWYRREALYSLRVRRSLGRDAARAFWAERAQENLDAAKALRALMVL